MSTYLMVDKKWIPVFSSFVAWIKKPTGCHTVACPRYPVKQLKILIILVFLTRSRE
ncbi:hypothetical protein H6P87_00840 [Rickettsia tillamookensis]|uniref:Uncharacterized protein n=1 Tax=Rickettsia tillamookensis TaxID=2761623 RepID=A0A9E6MHT0_9RICK|nr:hypothetical protein H6P87_00840 [Rickettsia tillamookensis]